MACASMPEAATPSNGTPQKRPLKMAALFCEKFWVFDVSCGIHASKSWVMGAPIR